MFGKLSLWAANTYHGPAIPKLDIQRDAQPVVYDALDDMFDSAWAPAVVFDIDVNPVQIAAWNDEQKAEFINANSALLPVVFAADPRAILLDESNQPVDIKSTYDILYQMPNYKLQFIVYNLYRLKFISAYLQDNNGTVSENLAAYLKEVAGRDLSQVKSTMEEYLLSIRYHNIPYVIKYGYHPVVLSEDPSEVHRVLLNLKNKPEIHQFMYFQGNPEDLIKKFCVSVEETHAMLRTAEIHMVYRSVYEAVVFSDFIKKYKDGIPADMHAKWIEYDRSTYMHKIPQFIANANRPIDPECHAMLYQYLLSNYILMDDILHHMHGHPVTRNA